MPVTAVLERRTLAAVFAGGALGGLLRTLLADAYPAAATSWPWVTFAVNLAGAFLLGSVVTALHERTPPPAVRRAFLGPGVCGGLTTFSTLQLELLEMLDHRSYVLAACYAAASVAGGFAAVGLATMLAGRLRRRTVA